MSSRNTANTSRQAIGYVRVSTEQQADSGLSIEAQRVQAGSARHPERLPA